MPSNPDDEPLSAYKAKLQDTCSRPLIEQVNNRWKTDDKQDPEKSAYHYNDDDVPHLRFCDLEDDSSCPNVSRNVISSRRFRRMFAVVLLAALLLYYAWRHYVQPPLEEDWAYKEGFVAQKNGTYGIAKGGDLDEGLVRLKDLEGAFVPGGEADPEGKRRLVFVGDVHGCKKELVKLLEEVGFREGMDHLVLVGDVISKGPDNVGVLDELIRLNATSVRGNHEDRILHAAKMQHGTLSTTTSSKGLAKDIALLKSLKPHHVEYIRSMPLMLHIPTLPMALKSTNKKNSPISEHILVVHAGVVPGVPFHKQDPYYVMNMRSINRRTHVPSVLRASSKNERPWFDVWGWYNDRIFRKQSIENLNNALQTDEQSQAEEAKGIWTDLWKNFWGERKVRPKPQVVVYGHDSKAGLQIKRWSKGLDSACVSGGELTAMVLDAWGQQEIFSVGCKNYRA